MLRGRFRVYFAALWSVDQADNHRGVALVEHREKLVEARGGPEG